MTLKRGDVGGHGGFAQTGPSEKSDASVAMVQALSPLWAGWGIVPVGTVYELEREAAAELAARGLVRVLGRDASLAPSVRLTEGEPEEVG